MNAFYFHLGGIGGPVLMYTNNHWEQVSELNHAAQILTYFE